MKDFEVTPWKATGEINYSYLVEKFGVNLIDNNVIKLVEKAFGELPSEIKRGLFFSHRDFDKVLKDFIGGKKPYLYTGRGPSGPMHIGHIIPFIFTKKLQEKFDTFVLLQFTSDEKYLYNPSLVSEQIRKYVIDNIKDVLAVGFDPAKTYVIEDFRHIKYLYQIAVSVARRLTYSTIRAVFGFTSETSIGMIFFASIQAAPAFLGYYINDNVYNCLIPAAIDQDPYWRIARDIAAKIRLPKPSQIHGKLLPGLKRDVKMSSSIPETAIYLSDDEDTVKWKMMNAFTGGQPTAKLQRKLGGKPDICVVYNYYQFLFEEKDDLLRERYENCKNGHLICGDCKNELIERINIFLKKHNEKKRKIRDKDIEKVMIDNKVNLDELVHRFKMLR